MAKDKKTLVALVLDETGSMMSVKQQTISGYNEYVNDLRSKGGFKFALTRFNSNKIDIGEMQPIKKAISLDNEIYVPRATTPLYDAIGHTIKSIEKYDGPVIFVVLTDGYENASREFTREQIFAIIQEKTKKGWTFVYLGADQDAWDVSQNLGFSQGNTLSYNSAKTYDTMRQVSINTINYSGGDFFSGDEDATPDPS